MRRLTVDVRDESLRWLTERGMTPRFRSNKKIGYGEKNRPVLLHANGVPITMKDARRHLGFSEVVVYGVGSQHFSAGETVKVNAALIEDLLQIHFQDRLKLPLGVRLWRHVAMGGGVRADEKDQTWSYKVFITFSDKYLNLLRTGAIILNSSPKEQDTLRKYLERDS